jgi:hypothetical protein
MSHEFESNSADYIVYLRHTSSSAATGYQSSSASPNAIATMMRNRITIFTPVDMPEPPADELPALEEWADEAE